MNWDEMELEFAKKKEEFMLQRKRCENRMVKPPL